MLCIHFTLIFIILPTPSNAGLITHKAHLSCITGRQRVKIFPPHILNMYSKQHIVLFYKTYGFCGCHVIYNLCMHSLMLSLTKTKQLFRGQAITATIDRHLEAISYFIHYFLIVFFIQLQIHFIFNIMCRTILQPSGEKNLPLKNTSSCENPATAVNPHISGTDRS